MSDKKQKGDATQGGGSTPQVQQLPTSRQLLHAKGDYVVCIMQLQNAIYDNSAKAVVTFAEDDWEDDDDDANNFIIDVKEVLPLPKEIKDAYGKRKMQEIAKTFSDIGLTPKILLGASDMYEMIAATSLGLESPEDARNKARDGQTIVNQLADESSK